MRNNRHLFLFVLFYFTLGFINIHLALLGLICMILPGILLFRDQRKTWCRGYCPRASLYTTIGKLTAKNSYKTPKLFIKGNMKWIMISYFSINLVIIIMSTLKVSGGAIPAMNYLRFLIVLPIPGEMPQLFEFSGIAPWITHLSYRFYSMMMTTAFIGLMMALIYKPRTWCTICPISTLSNVYLKSKKIIPGKYLKSKIKCFAAKGSHRLTTKHFLFFHTKSRD